MNSKEILNELRKEMDEIKQKPLSKPEVYMMSWNEKYQLDNKLLCLQIENTKLKKIIKILITKSVNKLILSASKDVNHYNQLINILLYFDELTQEEYDLLKEVFGE